MKIPVLSVWPGSDGADYHFQIDYRQSIEWFTEALIAVNSKCLEYGIKLAIEPKPYEPRELYMIIPTAASAILVAQKVNAGLRRQQLRPDDRLRPSEDGGDHRVDRRATWPSLPACRCTSSTSTTRVRAATIRT